MSPLLSRRYGFLPKVRQPGHRLLFIIRRYSGLVAFVEKWLTFVTFCGIVLMKALSLKMPNHSCS